MLQRIQSVWLLIASLLSFATLWFPFFAGNKIENGVNTFISYTAKDNFIVLILNIAVAVAALVIIFLYKDRKQQIKITVASLIVSLIALIVLFTKTSKTETTVLALTSLIYFAIPVFLVLAIIAIWKDEKLVKSADRLR